LSDAKRSRTGHKSRRHAASDNRQTANVVDHWGLAGCQGAKVDVRGTKAGDCWRLMVVGGRKQISIRRRYTRWGELQGLMACLQACSNGRAIVSHGPSPRRFRALFDGWEEVRVWGVSPGETGPREPSFCHPEQREEALFNSEAGHLSGKSKATSRSLAPLGMTILVRDDIRCPR